MPRNSGGSRSADSSSLPSVSYPRYTTYTPEELERTLARYRHIGAREGADATVPSSGRTRLIKSHECCVTYPDGTSGTCRYTRGGPTWHVFEFTHDEANQLKQLVYGRPISLPRRNVTERMTNTLAAIEAKATEMAHVAYADAVCRERDERFKRATPPSGHNRYVPQSQSTKQSSGETATAPLPQMSVKRAKELAGKYALCLRLGDGERSRFLPSLNSVYNSIDEANDAWRQHEHRARRFVACACRYSRQWELPLYNPLHADPEYAALIGFNNKPLAVVSAATE